MIANLDLSRAELLKISETSFNSWRVKEIIEGFDRYGGFEKMRDFLLKKLFQPSRFLTSFLSRPYAVESTVDRYHMLEWLGDIGAINRDNLNGEILDIGCHLGATLDALALYGGKVHGCDKGCFATESPSGIKIGWDEGRRVVNSYSPSSLNFISCFNADWVEEMSEKDFTFKLYSDAMSALKTGGELFYSFWDKSKDLAERLSELPNTLLIELVPEFSKREQLVLVAKK